MWRILYLVLSNQSLSCHLKLQTRDFELVYSPLALLIQAPYR
jgi:hypothetical protein